MHFFCQEKEVFTYVKHFNTNVETIFATSHSKRFLKKQSTQKQPFRGVQFETALWHGRSPVNFPHIFITTFLKTRMDDCFCQSLSADSRWLHFTA